MGGESEYRDNEVDMKKVLVFVFRVNLVVWVCLGRIHGSLGLVQWCASILCVMEQAEYL